MAILFDPTSRLLGEMIQHTALRHRVLASNLANVETPAYQAQEATFSVALEEAQGNAGSAARPALRTAVATDPDAAVREDGNSVDMDRQMVKLTQNSIWHSAMIQMLNSRFSLLKTAIKDRG